MITEQDKIYMQIAIGEAKKALQEGEIPIGAVLVDKNGNILAQTHNKREQTNNPLSHAECEALEIACKDRKERFFTDCTLYVTLEPCPMCGGALISARIGRVVYGAKDARAGAFGSVLNLSDYPLESKPVIESDLLSDECLTPLRTFFRNKRNKK